MGDWGPVLGVLSPVVGDYYFGAVIDGIATAARAAGGTVVALQTLDAGADSGEQAALEPSSAPVSWDFLDGFVVLVNSVTHAEIERLVATGKPVVTVSARFDGVDVPNVAPDNSSGIRSAVEHLVRHGHSRIGFAGGGGHRDIAERHEAYRLALREHGIQPDPAWYFDTTDGVCAPYTEEGGVHAGRALLAAGLPTTAIICATDYNAVGVIRTLQEAGYVVPRDQAVIGFDDTDVAWHINPPVASISQNFDKIGGYAGALVLRMLAGESVSRGDHFLPTRLIARASCGCWHPELNVDGRSAASTRLETALAALVEVDDGSHEHSVVVECCTTISAWAQRVAASAAVPRDVGAPEAIETLYRLAPRPETSAGIIRTLEQYVETCASGPAPAGNATRVLAEAAIFLSGVQVSHEYRSAERLERTLSAQFEINMALLKTVERGATSLEWVSATDASTACFAVWSGRPSHGRSLDIMGWFDREWPLDREFVGTSVPSTAFPPRSLIEGAMGHPEEIVFVIPVRRRGQDRGLLAVSAPIEKRSSARRQTFNQWVAMLAVALVHEEVLQRLQDQRAELCGAYRRERALREEIRLSEERYAIALRAANDGIWDWDLRDGRVYFSERCLELLGIPGAPSDGVLDLWLDRVHPSDAAGLRSALADHAAGTTASFEHQHRVLGATGAGFGWVLVQGSVVRDEHGNAVRMVGSLSDIDDRRRHEERLRRAALFDPLTGLPNRALFLDRLGQAVAAAQRRPSHHYAVLFLDLDGFKFVNDGLGHHAGDLLLQVVARAITGSLRESDTGARFGGDEFAILLDSVSDLADVPVIAERLQRRLATPLLLDGQEVVVSASIGIALSSAGYTSTEDVLRDADAAMYRSKARGRGDHTVFDTTVRDRALVGQRIGSGAPRAMRNELDLRYLPIVALDPGGQAGPDALAHRSRP
jgi:diguanylate cyclase (GGDEF)-like protein